MTLYKPLAILAGLCFLTAMYMVVSGHTAISTMLSLFKTPSLMKLLAGALVDIDVQNMMWDITKMVILSIGAGLLFNRLFSGKAKWLDHAMPVVSMTGIAKEMGKIATIGPAPAIFGPLMNVTGSLLASWWRKSSPHDRP